MIKSKLMVTVCVMWMALSTGSSAYAQSTDGSFRVNELEEQVRQLNGRIEDLNFQLLQMQELIRKMQQDNEFRFQELEEKSDAGGTVNDGTTIGDLIKPSSSNQEQNRLGKPLSSEQSTIVEIPDVKQNSNLDGRNVIKASKMPRMIDGVEIYDGTREEAGTIAKSLGTIIYDGNGNFVDGTVGAPMDLTKKLYGGGDTNVRLAVPENADELYSLGYSYIQSGDYALAEEAFSDFLARFPEHERVADVNFWLGESHFARKQYKEAARIFLNAHRNWPDARLAPQTLLKLGVSVAGLNQRELACATYAEIGQKYPKSSIIVKRNVRVEQQAARCSVN